MQTFTHARTRTYRRKCAHMRGPKHAHAHTCMCYAYALHTLRHVHAHTNTHMRPCAYTDTYTHTTHVRMSVRAHRHTLKHGRTSTPWMLNAVVAYQKKNAPCGHISYRETAWQTVMFKHGNLDGNRHSVYSSWKLTIHHHKKISSPSPQIRNAKKFLHQFQKKPRNNAPLSAISSWNHNSSVRTAINYRSLLLSDAYFILASLRIHQQFIREVIFHFT